MPFTVLVGACGRADAAGGRAGPAVGRSSSKLSMVKLS
jgi:hypothetical protein